MKNIVNNTDLFCDQIKTIGGPDFTPFENRKFMAQQLMVEGTFKSIIGGTASIVGGTMTYLGDVYTGSLIMSAGLATYMNGRELIEEAERL